MRSTFFPTFAGALCLGAVCVWQASAPADDAVPDVPNGAAQARGPVHEAYAEPAETRPEAGPIIPKQPPEPIQEQPPDQKPAGDSIVWIPGYWAWDDETTDFTWISGFWRDPPPSRVWTPGHWQEVDGGWQWVAGLWAAQNAQEVEYLPPPPASIDNGPSIPATDETSTYVPGCWVYRETRYLWRPGYWVEANPNWCWIPDHYCWTPAGYLFVGGYWDYPLESRGLLFAPVRFERRVYEERDFVYTPEFVIQPDFLLGALFVRPAYCHYYFGDYFEDRYENRGFTSWVDFRVGRHSYDPNFAFYRRRYRDDDHWETSLRDLYALRRSGDVPRPPRTLIQQTQIVNNITINKTENVAINKNIQITNIQNVTALTPINQAENVKVTGLSGLTGIPVKVRPGGVAAAAIPAPRAIKLEPVSKERQAEVKTHVMQMHQFAAAQQKEQAKIVSAGAMPLKPTDRPKTVKVEMPRDPGKPAKPGIERNVPVPPPTPKNEPPLQSAPARVRTPTPGAKEPPPVLRKEPPLSPAKEPPLLPRKEPPTVKEPPVLPRKEPPTVKEPPVLPRKEPPTVKEPPLPPRESPPVPVRKEPPSLPAQKTPPPLPPRESPPVPVRKEPPPPPPVQKAPPPPPPRESPPVPAHKEPPPPPPVHKEPPPPPPVHKEPPPPAPVRAAPPPPPPAPVRAAPPPPPPAPVRAAPPPPPAPVRAAPPAPPSTKEPPKGKPPQMVSAQRK